MGMKNRLILASKSPRRNEFMKQLGFDVEVIPSGVEEDVIQKGSSRLSRQAVKKHAVDLAEAKALDVGRRYSNRWIIAADTMVYVDGSILGQPKTSREAIGMLRCLSGREHWVFTGFSVQHREKGMGDREVVQTAVKMKTLTSREMEWYVRSGEPFDKAGGYAIQGIGSFMIESIRGSYTNVVGLPLYELIRMLIRLGAVAISDRGFRMVN
jgi:septum formation protein